MKTLTLIVVLLLPSMAFAQVAGGITSGIGGAATNAIGQDGIINVKNYGAICDGTTDDRAAFQSAYNAACTATVSTQGSFVTPEVFIPSGRCYSSQPIIANCAHTVPIIGADKTSTILSTGGFGVYPFFVAYPSTFSSYMGAITASSLATGSGTALSWPGQSTPKFYFNLNDILVGKGFNGVNCSQAFNGLAAFDVRFYFNWSPFDNSNRTYTAIASAGSDHSTAALDAGAFQVAVFGSNAGNGSLRVNLNVSGTPVSINGGNNVTANATHVAELSFDGTTVRSFLDGVSQGTASQAGTVTQRLDETVMLGGHTSNGWPDMGAQEGWSGQLDSVEISKVARNTSTYTAPTAKFAGDANSLLLMNFVTTATVSPYIYSVERLNGNASQGATSFMVARGGGGPAQGPKFIARNFTNTSYGVGVLVMAEPQSELLDIINPNTGDAAIILYGNSYSSIIDDLSTTGGCTAVQNDDIGGYYASNVQVTGAIYGLITPWTVTNYLFSPSTSGVSSIVWQNQTATSNAVCTNCSTDVENGGSMVPYKIIGGGSYVINGGDLQTNTASNVELIDVNAGASFNLSLYGTEGFVGASTPELIHFITAAGQVAWYNPTINGVKWSANTIPLSDSAANAMAIGDVFQPPQKTFANLPTSPINGWEIYCPDCAIANPCAGSGNGAMAKRLNGAWVCN